MADQVESALSDSVAARMVADVPVGAFLSGGVDSSVIVALMQQHSATPVRTFTVGFADRAFDESAEAAAVAAHLGTDHTPLDVTDARRPGGHPHLAGHLGRALRRRLGHPHAPGQPAGPVPGDGGPVRGRR